MELTETKESSVSEHMSSFISNIKSFAPESKYLGQIALNSEKTERIYF